MRVRSGTRTLALVVAEEADGRRDEGRPARELGLRADDGLRRLAVERQDVEAEAERLCARGSAGGWARVGERGFWHSGVDEGGSLQVGVYCTGWHRVCVTGTP